jgi:IclR family transcriptional regulator, mhp operon transcriptional activator
MDGSGSGFIDIRHGEAEAEDGLIRAAERTLDILRSMNQRPVSSIDYLHRETGLPKSTLVRFLKTLARAGYVTNDPRQAGYQLTAQVRSLSSGYHGLPLVVEAGRPLVVQLTRQIKWPVSIAVLEGHSVVVRLSTVVDSPMSPFHSTINMRLGLFTRGLGRAYMAFCEDAEIADFAAQTVAANDEGAEIAADADAVRTLVAGIRRRGYALRDPRIEPQSSDTLAVPIFLDGKVRATLAMTYFRSAVRTAAMIEGYAEQLQEVSKAISAETDRLRGMYGTDHTPPFA